MSTALKVRPRVWIGLAIYLGYIAVVFTVQLVSGVRYDELGASGSNLFFGAGLSLIIATVLLALTTTLLGWWRPALFDRHRSVRWPIIAPILMVVALVFNLISTDWAAFDGAFLAAALVILLVGFTEEITTRGLLLTGLRSRLSEGWVWFLTSFLFGAMHLLNATGQALGATIQQVVFAFIAGTVFYILRRVTGTLIWAMVLHGMWDFSTFALSHGTPGPLAGIGATINLIAGVFALIAVAFVIRGTDERTPVNGGGRP
ncbi:CPBP family intramembrane glutamic endopeptidase [Plantibacter sp. VKM Ac-2885]|uniref:CPBP family intramembrane glutamic endopeptidase n=1 Tax=Plantibacter sp. VKM Ac-2885 TaxID=2783828 RepID=UPI001E4C6B53|nr:CPBP family intramembrane glutamic endopeptidase [Plantibacter sp. VKM Ac-2885]